MRRVMVVVLVLCSSCAVAFMERVPADWHYTREPRCTETMGWVGWDALIAIASVTAGVYVLVQGQKLEEAGDLSESEVGQFNALAIASFVHAGLRVPSAIAGTRWAERCSEARAKRDRYLEWREKRTAPAAPAKAPAAVTAPEPPAPAPIVLDAGVPDMPADAGVAPP